ncbi:hypothetical protein [Sphingomonas sp.]|uniref:hypothetical protein n=1 Tax=Sphingomonas sp. TaxID=28214 RepID=UPI0035C7C1A2
MRTFLYSLTAAAIALAATSSTAAPRPDANAELRQLLAGRVAGKPIDCLPLTTITGNTIVTGRAIVYRVGARLYVNEPRGDGARWLHRDDVLVTRTVGSNLCRLDIVRLLDRTSRIPGPFVSLGQFVPYTKPRGG